MTDRLSRKIELASRIRSFGFRQGDPAGEGAVTRKRTGGLAVDNLMAELGFDDDDDDEGSGLSDIIDSPDITGRRLNLAGESTAGGGAGGGTSDTTIDATSETKGAPRADDTCTGGSRATGGGDGKRALAAAANTSARKWRSRQSPDQQTRRLGGSGGIEGIEGGTSSANVRFTSNTAPSGGGAASPASTSAGTPSPSRQVKRKASRIRSQNMAAGRQSNTYQPSIPGSFFNPRLRSGTVSFTEPGRSAYVAPLPAGAGDDGDEDSEDEEDSEDSGGEGESGLEEKGGGGGGGDDDSDGRRTRFSTALRHDSEGPRRAKTRAQTMAFQSVSDDSVDLLGKLFTDSVAREERVLRSLEQLNAMQRAVIRSVLSEEQVMQLLASFNQFDEDGNGCLDSNEFRVLFTSLVSTKGITSFFDDMDLDHDNKVDFGEFVLAIAKFLGRHHKEHHDEDGDGEASSQAVLADMIADVGARNLLETTAVPVIFSWWRFLTCLVSFTLLWPVVFAVLVCVQCGACSRRGGNKENGAAYCWCCYFCCRLPGHAREFVTSLPTLPPAFSVHTTLVYQTILHTIYVVVGTLYLTSPHRFVAIVDIQVASMFLLFLTSIVALSLLHGYGNIPIMRYDGLARQTSSRGLVFSSDAAALPKKHIERMMRFRRIGDVVSAAVGQNNDSTPLKATATTATKAMKATTAATMAVATANGTGCSETETPMIRKRLLVKSAEDRHLNNEEDEEKGGGGGGGGSSGRVRRAGEKKFARVVDASQKPSARGSLFRFASSFKRKTQRNKRRQTMLEFDAAQEFKDRSNLSYFAVEVADDGISTARDVLNKVIEAGSRGRRVPMLAKKRWGFTFAVTVAAIRCFVPVVLDIVLRRPVQDPSRYTLLFAGKIESIWNPASSPSSRVSERSSSERSTSATGLFSYETSYSGSVLSIREACIVCVSLVTSTAILAQIVFVAVMLYLEYEYCVRRVEAFSALTHPRSALAKAVPYLNMHVRSLLLHGETEVTLLPLRETGTNIALRAGVYSSYYYVYLAPLPPNSGVLSAALLRPSSPTPPSSDLGKRGVMAQYPNVPGKCVS